MGMTRRGQLGPVVGRLCVVAALSGCVTGGATQTSADTPPEILQHEAYNADSLKTALEAYDENNFPLATALLEQVAGSSARPGDPNVAKAEFFLGKIYHRQKRFNESYATFQRIVAGGRSHPYYLRTLEWLVALSHVMPPWVNVVETIAKYDPTDFEDPTVAPDRDELYFLVGQYMVKVGHAWVGRTLLEKVRPQSAFFRRAHEILHPPAATESR